VYGATTGVVQYPRPVQERSGRTVAAMIVGGVGAGLLAAGVLVYSFFPKWIDAEVAWLQSLPVLEAAQFSDTPSGRDVLVEGRIAGDQPAVFRNFVACFRQEREYTDNNSKNWRGVQAQTPPLRIEVEDGVIPFTVGTYDLLNTTEEWRDPGGNGRIETRYVGLVAGQPVLVMGVSSDRGITARFVTVGTRDSYLRAQARGAVVVRWLGVLFGGIGTLLLVIAAFVAFYRRRTP
jgi:hypothetical protein